MKKHPNLFIVGAPKCGTTSLFNALSKHSLVHPSPNKEPHFYSTDIYEPCRLSRLQYLQLFSGAKPTARWLMEGSTRTLYSNVAIDKILTDQPLAKFIVMVRDPVEMIYSLHNHQYFLGRDLEIDFKKAWKKSFEFDRDHLIASGCKDPDSLRYCEIGLLGRQLERFNGKVAQDKRLVLFYEDVRDKPQEVLTNVLNFLDIEYENGMHIAKDNRSMKRRSETLHNTIEFFGKVKKMLGIRRSFHFLDWVRQLNRVNSERTALDPVFSAELFDYFEDDIKIIEVETGRDLSLWRARYR